MQRAVRVIETYMPGLAAMTGAWYDRLQGDVAATLSAQGLSVALLAIPDDETLLWVVWSQLDRPDLWHDVAVAVVEESADGGGSPVLERAVDGRFVIRQITETEIESGQASE